MAAELSRFGIPVRIIEKAPQRTDKSKALVLWSRTLELLDRANCGRNFVEAGCKVTGANIIAAGQDLAHIRLDEVPTPHPYALMLPQSDTERLLRNTLQPSRCQWNVKSNWSSSILVQTALPRNCDTRTVARKALPPRG